MVRRVPRWGTREPKTSFMGVVFDVDHDFEGPRAPKAHLDTVNTNLLDHLRRPFIEPIYLGPTVLEGLDIGDDLADYLAESETMLLRAEPSSEREEDRTGTTPTPTPRPSSSPRPRLVALKCKPDNFTFHSLRWNSSSKLQDSRRSPGFHSVSGLVAIGLHLYCTRWQRSATKQAIGHEGGGLTCVSLNSEVQRLRGSPTATRRAEQAASNVLPALHSSHSTPAAPAQTPRTVSSRAGVYHP